MVSYEPVLTISGQFIEFDIQMTQTALEYGYWRFASDGKGQEDALAFSNGFTKPEQILSAVGRGDTGSWETIELTWHPGSLDTWQYRRQGTASQHIAEIAEERSLLGLPHTLAGDLAMYPVDHDRQILAHRMQTLDALGSPPGESRSMSRHSSQGPAPFSSSENLVHDTDDLQPYPGIKRQIEMVPAEENPDDNGMAPASKKIKIQTDSVPEYVYETLSEERLFQSDLIPLSEAVPCVVCEETRTHKYDCIVARDSSSKSPPKDEQQQSYKTNLSASQPSNIDWRLLQEQVDNPEQWPNDPDFLQPNGSGSPAKVGINETIRQLKHYRQDPLLHLVPEAMLPMAWAARTSTNIHFQLLSANGEIYDPGHSVWANEKHGHEVT